LNGISDTNATIEVKIKELNGINRILQDNKDALTSLYMDKVKKIITEDEYITMKETFRHTIDEQQVKYSKIKNEIENLKILSVEKPDALTLAKEYSDFEELTTEIVMNFIDYVEVGEKDMYGNQDMHIYWNI
jgi:hypothetical protein